MDARNAVLIPELTNTVQAKPNGGRSLNCTPNVIYPRDNVRCLTPWDIESIRTYDADGVWHTLYASSEKSSLMRDSVVYAIDQQGGKGNACCAVDVMPSILSDSHGTPHGVAYAVQMDGSSKPDTVRDKTPTLTVPDKQSKVMATAYAVDLYNGEMGGVFATLNANSCVSANHAGPAVCFKTATENPVEGGVAMFENHAHDSRYTGPLKVSQTVSQLFGTGGNNTPLIVEVKA